MVYICIHYWHKNITYDDSVWDDKRFLVENLILQGNVLTHD